MERLFYWETSMSNFSLDLLNQAAKQITGQDAYAAVAAGDSNRGMATASPVEQAIRALNPRQLMDQMGQNAGAVLDTVGPASVRVQRDANTSRDLNQVAADTVTDVGTGVVNTFGNIAAWGVGAINKEAGIGMAGAMKDFNTFAQGTQSAALNSQRRLVESQTNLELRDSAAQFQTDLKNDSELVASLKRIGRETLIGAKGVASSSATLGSGIAQGIGSLLGGAAVAGGRAAAIPFTSVASEGGGAYVDTANKVMEMKQADLEKHPDYAEMESLGMTDQEIRTTMANSAGHIAGLVTAPAAFLAGKAMAGFEASPLTARAASAALANAVGETVEEGVVGGFQSLGANVGVRATANPNQALTEGVGRGIGEGAVLGLGTAGAVQVPGVVAKTGIQLLDGLASRGQAIREAVQSRSPVSADKVQQRVDATVQAQATPEAQQAVQEMVTSAAEAAQMSPETEQAMTNYTNQVISSLAFNPEVESTLPGIPAAVQPALAQKTNRVEAIEALRDFVADENTSAEDRIDAAKYLNDMMNNMMDVVLHGNEITSEIPGDHPIHAFLGDYFKLYGDVMNMSVMKDARELLKKSVEDNPLAVTENNVTQRDANQVVLQAELDPQKVDPAQAQIVLSHAARGSIELTPTQQAALNTAVSLVQAANKYYSDLNAQGQATDRIGQEIQVSPGQGSKGLSAAAYGREVYANVRAGNLDTARQQLMKFQNFVQSQQNKVNALNAHYVQQNPEGQEYQTIDWENDSGWFTAPRALFVNPKSERSIALAQRIAAESGYVTDVFNGLVEAFPQLGLSTVQSSPALNPALQGKADEIAQAAKQPVTTPAPAPAEPKPARKAAAPAVESKVTAAVKSAAQAMQEFDQVVEQTRAKETPAPAPVDPEPTPEPKQETPAPKVEESPEPMVEEEVAKEEEAPATGVLAVHPNLVGGESNRFVANFSFPTNPISRLTGLSDSLKQVVDAIGSSKAFAAFSGKTPTYTVDKDVSAAYRSLLSKSRPVARSMIDRMNKRIEKVNNSKAYPEINGKSFKELMLAGEDVSRFPNTRVLALADVVDGEVTYNFDMLQQGIIAGLSWLTTMDKTNPRIDRERAASILGIDEDAVSADMIQFMNQGTLMLPVVDSLNQKVTKFLGMRAKKDAYIGVTQGITEGFSKEIIHGLEDAGLLTRNEMTFMDSDGKPRTMVTYQANLDNLSEDLNKFPGALDELVLTQPEYVYYVGDVRPAVAETQLHQPGVNNTASQKSAIANEQNTPNYLNLPMLGVFKAMGKDAILKLFGEGDLSARELNQNHRTSLEGRNLSFAAAFDEMLNVEQAMRAESAKSGKDLGDVELFYEYNMTSVGRMQQLAKYGNQSSKLMREVVMPTRDVVDLSKPEINNAFTLGLAQALGIKVHKEPSIDAIRTKTQALFQGPLKRSVDNFVDWLKSADMLNHDSLNNLFESSKVDDLLADFKAAGVDNTPVAVMAVMEYARSLAEDNTNFLTHLYVEADGVTNGVINAMMNYTTGGFTPDWIKVVNKGGVHFSNVPFTNNQQQAFDNKDIYKTVADRFVGMLGDMRKALAMNPPVQKHMDEVTTLMRTMFKEVYLDAQGNLVVDRGIAKNPVTITTYGSGVKGIGGKLASAIVDDIYSRLSDFLEAKKTDPNVDPAQAMFGKDSKTPAEAAQRFADFSRTWNILTESQVKKVVRNKVGVLTVLPAKVGPKKAMNPQTFTVDADRKAVLADNVTRFFAEPLATSANQTIGENTMGTLSLIQQVTQAQSIYATSVFRKKIADLVQAKKAADPAYNEADFITQTELNAIRKEMVSMGALIKTKGQQFFIPGSQNSDIGVRSFSQDLNGAMSTAPSIFGPANAGVRAMPILNIGTGDGYAMQALANMDGAAIGSLKIFDGVNLKMSTVFEDSVKANEAVFASWVNNPLNGVVEAAKEFSNHFSLSNMTQEGIEELADTLDIQAESLVFEFQRMVDQLEGLALSAQARVNTIKRVGMSIDQMAAAMSPFVREGEQIASNDPDAQAEKLNAVYQEERAKLEKDRKEAAKTDALDPATLGTEDASGVRIGKLSSVLNDVLGSVPQHLNRTLKSMYGADLSQFSLVSGTAEHIAQYAGSRGIAFPDLNKEGTNGFINTQTNTVFLVSPSAETLVHETVHAATFSVLLAHYQGNTNPAVSGAVSRLEALMEQFRELSDTIAVQGRLVAPAYQQALAAINGAALEYGLTTPEGQAAALNEFMAWGLANKDLGDLLKNQKANPLARIAREVWQAIKEVIFGNRNIPTAGADMLSNLQFNASVLAQSQPSLTQQDSNVVLFHTSPQLEILKDRLAEKVINKLNATELQQGMMEAVDLAQEVQAAGFVLNQDELAIFRTAVVAMQSGLDMDTVLMTRLAELHAHVIRGLKPADLGANGQAKFDLLTGANKRLNAEGRSNMLSAFLGLSMVSDEFRALLDRKPLPKRQTNTEGTLDAQLENLGNSAIDKLSQVLSGEGTNSNTRQALDSLTQKMAERIQENSTLTDQFMKPVGSFIDKANAKVSEAIGEAGERIYSLGEKLEQGNNKYTKAAAQLLKLSASLASDTRASAAAEGILATLNRTDAFEPLRTLVYDFIGSTESNKDMFRLVKMVRTTVQQSRQNYRTEVPKTIKSMLKDLSDEQWSSLHTSIGKTDITSLLSSVTRADLTDILTTGNVGTRITDLEAAIKAADPNDGAHVINKAKQLAKFMMTGEAGPNLLRNAEAVSALLGEGTTPGRTVNAALVQNVDALVSLYAFDSLGKDHKTNLKNIMNTQAAGLGFLISYMEGQRKDEIAKETSATRYNSVKGYMPVTTAEGTNLMVADDANFAELAQKGYTRVGNYDGSSLNRSNQSRGYYFSPVGSRSAFRQGIMQVARNTAGGVDRNTGLSVSTPGGVIRDRATLARMAGRLHRDTGKETLIPVYDAGGKLVALERSITQQHTDLLRPETDLANVIGIWRGRQVEEFQAGKINGLLVDKLHDMYTNGNPDEFVDVMASNDPVIQAAVKNITKQTRAHIENVFGANELWVRREMLNDVLGYHAASVGDVWTGNSRWSKETQEAAKNVATAIFGPKAYQYAVNSEQFLQQAVGNAKTLIVVKSVIVPVGNMISNVFQLAMRGVPVAKIAKEVPKKIAETAAYERGMARVVELEARKRAADGANNTTLSRKLDAEIQAINDSFRRMSIWPLIGRGEYSTVSDASTPGSTDSLAQGKFADFIEGLVDRLPPGIRTAGRYALITKDTALFQGLQKSVQYGDFVAKAILYDDMIKRQKLNSEDALDKVSEEFVNYDRLPGRWRDGLESNGLLWFYNYKIRITKVALSILRNNPVHALLASGAAPYADFAGDVGLPTEDNFFSKMWDGKLGSSIGFGMGFRAPGMNPWESLIN